MLVALGLFAAPARAQTVLITFDELDPSRGDVLETDVADYLARFGVTIAAQTSTSGRPRLTVQGGSPGAPYVPNSFPNVLAQINGNGEVSYTLRFNQPVTRVRFVRVAYVPGPNGVITPMWRATANDVAGRVIGSTGEDLHRIFDDSDPRTRPNNVSFAAPPGAGIASITIYSSDQAIAGMASPAIDDLEITPID